MSCDFNGLRAKALEALSTKTPVDNAAWGNDIKRLIEELSIHQIELEYQNEELLKAQVEIQKTSDKYANLFNSAPIGYIIIDTEHTIIDVNNTFCRFIRADKEEIVSNSIERYISPLYQDSFYHFFKLIERTGVPAYVELKMRFMRGEEAYVSINGIKCYQSNMYQLAITDISPQKRLEERLRLETEKAIKNETHFRQIVERSSDIFYYRNIATGKFDYISPLVIDLLGFSQDECLNMTMKTYLSLILPQYRDIYIGIEKDLIEAELNGQESIIYELQMLTKTNNIKWIRGNYTLIKDNANHPFQIMGTLHDITNNKEYEEYIINAKEKAEENDNLKSIFLANMSHEIRTPLNAIIGFSDVIMDDMQDKMDKETLSYINIIHKNGQRMLELFNDIILLSKIEARQMEVKCSEFDLNQLLHDTYDIFKLEAKDKKLIMRCTNDSIPLMVYTDKDKITSCIQNLVKNALKYTNKGFVEFKADVTDNILNFSVSDSGIGIPDDKKAKIFERFQQLDDTSSKDGVGLGLSLVRGIMNLLGGTIKLESKLGKGSTFSFSLPLLKH